MLNDLPSVPFQLAPSGVDLGNCVVAQSCGLVLYVRSTGPQSGDPPELTGRIYPTLQSAMAGCRSGAFDTIYVLPGHVETISTAAFFSNLVAGTRIVGLGDGTSRPTLTWSAAGSTWLLNKANVTIDNMRLLLAPNAGSVTVAAPITVSGAGVTIRRCYIEVGTTAARLCTTAITVAAGADDFQLVGNTIWGATAATPTDCVLVNAAVNRPVIVGNDIQVATSATGEGPITFATAAAVDVQVKNNYIVHKLASSTVGIKGIASLTGVIADNYIGIQAATGGAAAINTPGNVALFQNFGAVPGKYGILSGTVSG